MGMLEVEDKVVRWRSIIPFEDSQEFVEASLGG